MNFIKLANKSYYYANIKKISMKLLKLLKINFKICTIKVKKLKNNYKKVDKILQYLKLLSVIKNILIKLIH